MNKHSCANTVRPHRTLYAQKLRVFLPFLITFQRNFYEASIKSYIISDAKMIEKIYVTRSEKRNLSVQKLFSGL